MSPLNSFSGLYTTVSKRQLLPMPPTCRLTVLIVGW